MGIFGKNNKPKGDEVKPVPDKPVIDDNRKKAISEIATAIHYSSDNDIVELTDSVAGFPWTVTFYNQILGTNDISNSLDIGKPIATQSYRVIKDMVVYLDSGLQSIKPDNIEGNITLDIEAPVYQGDIIVAKMHGRLAMLSVDEVTIRRYETNTMYYASFKLLTFLDDNNDHELYTNLLDKVATTNIYVDDDLCGNTNKRIMDEDTYKFIKGGIKTVDLLFDKYIAEYFSKLYRYFILELDKGTVIDPYLNDFIIKFFSPDDYRTIAGIERYGGGEDRERKMTIFDLIIEGGDISFMTDLYFCLKDRGIRAFHNYTPFDYEVTSDKERVVDDLVPNKSYFLSDNFTGDETLTDKFEELLRSFIDNGRIDLLMLNEEIKNVNNYSYEEGYFKTPILITLFKIYLLDPSKGV